MAWRMRVIECITCGNSRTFYDGKVVQEKLEEFRKEHAHSSDFIEWGGE